jgi:hypothetical protein
MRRGNTRCIGTLYGDNWERIYSTILTSATTSITISSLDGDIDEEYMLIGQFVGGYNGSVNYLLRPNNDMGSNYGRQTLVGEGSVASAARQESSTIARIGTVWALNHLCLSDTLIYAKSGYIRTIISKKVEDASGTTVGLICIQGIVWNNTVDNITSLVIESEQTNGIGVGTHIELYKKRKKI